MQQDAHLGRQCGHAQNCGGNVDRFNSVVTALVTITGFGRSNFQINQISGLALDREIKIYLQRVGPRAASTTELGRGELYRTTSAGQKKDNKSRKNLGPRADKAAMKSHQGDGFDRPPLGACGGGRAARGARAHHLVAGSEDPAIGEEPFDWRYDGE
jgi:hypothetical protein